MRINKEKQSRMSLLKKLKSAKIVLDFTKSLSVLLNAGIPLVKALTTLMQQAEDSDFKPVLKSIINRVNKGKTFSEALTKHIEYFDAMYIHIVSVGEKTAKLGLVLEKHADYLLKIRKMKQRLMYAMLYPAIIIVFSFLVVTFLILFLFPTISEIFTEFNTKIPTITKFILQINENFPTILFSIIGIIVISVLFFKYNKLSPESIAKLHRFQMRIPLINNIILQNTMSRLCRTTGLLIESGESLSQSLRIGLRVINNQYLKKKTKIIQKQVKSGSSLNKAFAKTGIFPQMVLQMVEVAEQSANLSEILVYIADQYDSELDKTIDALSSLLEPILILFISVIIGGIVIALYLPLFDMVTIAA